MAIASPVVVGRVVQSLEAARGKLRAVAHASSSSANCPLVRQSSACFGKCGARPSADLAFFLLLHAQNKTARIGLDAECGRLYCSVPLHFAGVTTRMTKMGVPAAASCHFPCHFRPGGWGRWLSNSARHLPQPAPAYTPRWRLAIVALMVSWPMVAGARPLSLAFPR